MAIRSPLYPLQVHLGARFTEFAGFEMPIQYSSIIEEHMAVRRRVGLFDVSHMSNVWISGKDAERLISLTTVEDAARIADGRSQYTEILREDGTIIDDTIFMHLGDRYMMIPNAGMATIVSDWLKKQAKTHNLKADVADVSRDYVILAIQGPRSQETLQKITDANLATVKFFGCQFIKVAGVDCIISHTGYTGELGFELQITPNSKAEGVFTKIMEAGKEFGISPIGLGARDTLRLEKAFMLAGNEFAGGRTPPGSDIGLDRILGALVHRQGGAAGTENERHLQPPHLPGMHREGNPAARLRHPERQRESRVSHERNALPVPEHRHRHGLRAPRPPRAGHDAVHHGAGQASERQGHQTPVRPQGMGTDARRSRLRKYLGRVFT